MTDPRKRLRSLEKQKNANATAAVEPMLMPSGIVDFVTSPKFLNRNLYPRQATLLKVMCLEVENLTDYDLGVIAEWEAGFTLASGDDGFVYEGRYGTAPGVVQRMIECRNEGRQWFREVVLVLGRRAGKGHLSALMASWVLWQLLAVGNVQEFFGIEQTKQLLVVTMAAGKDQAEANLHRDVVNIVHSARCFQPYLGRKGTDLRLRTPAELAAGGDPEGSILVEARPTTSSSGRGSAGIIYLFDEMAWAPADGQARGADAVYAGTTPSLAQFPQHSLCVLASSPASQTGEFYAAHVRALLADADGSPIFPDTFTLVLPSWETYTDWELTRDGLPMWPGGENFRELTHAFITPDSAEVRAMRSSNRETYLVESEAQWRSSLASYLDRDLVHAIFGPYNGAAITMQHARQPAHRYFMWCDPSTVGANFGVAIGHLEGNFADGHAVFDYLHAFEPKNFPDGTIDYPYVQEELWKLMLAFRPARIAFDQCNSAYLIQMLNSRLREAGLASSMSAVRIDATAPRNWASAEQFKTLVGERRVHAPLHKLARDELLFLECRNQRVDSPSHGPIQTSDIADCMIGVVSQMLDPAMNAIANLTGAELLGTYPAGMEPFRPGQPAWAQRPMGVHAQPSSPSRGARMHRGGRRW